ncbi:MAG: putative radical family enzyme, coproporphyrinogen oxidase, oxygen-independent [Oscillospiraceae bacterium]|nr:putative radical family enzyme, coproporphyrinogen oxidase, oxygen-independent [Oscillospiraceae bacterium]
MKLYLNHSYRYAVEQTLMSLFPGDAPLYPEAPPRAGENALYSSLSYGKQWVTACAVLIHEGKQYRRRARAEIRALSDELERGRVLQRMIRLSFYRAAADALGEEPPWGALTGVRPVKLPVKAMEHGLTRGQAETRMKSVYRVSPSRLELVMSCADACLAAKQTLTENEISLYIGIPFCPSRCAYCSFVSAEVGRSLKLVEPFLEGLLEEVYTAGAMLRRTGKTVRSVYIGGGTPTTLSASQLERLMGAVGDSFDLSRCTEYTVEAGRPDTITAEKAAVIAACGAGRTSVNPQSMEDAALRAMGRPHTAVDVLRAYELVRRTGSLSVNMDLIAGLPGSTPGGFFHSLDTVLSLEPENITVHTLALKKGSSLLTGGRFVLPSAEEVTSMLEYAWRALAQAGYKPYYLYRQKYMSGSFENVGWCMPGRQSIYNICMMEELHSVLALGGGGITKLVNPATGAIRRISNPKYPREYIERLPHILAEKEQMIWPINSAKSTAASGRTPRDF